MKTLVRYRSNDFKSAMRDVFEYLGKKRSKVLIDYLTEVHQKQGGKALIRAARGACMLAGIEGLPYRAVLRYVVYGEVP